MSPRLLAELTRLFPGPAALGSGAPGSPGAPGVLGTQGPPGHGSTTGAASATPPLVHWLVLGLDHRAGAEPLGRVWQGLQSELALPPPALAVDGQALLQLWLPLAEPVPTATAAAWLAAVRQRWLADLPAHRIHTWPAAPSGTAGAPAEGGVADAPALPPQPVGEERWSAFVSPDLLPVFADSPWLDLPPGDDAQAALLARVPKASPAAWRAACAGLGVPPVQVAQPAASTGPSPASAGAGAPPPLPALPAAAALPTTVTRPDGPLPGPVDAAELVAGPAAAAGDSLAARRFLRQVMDDPSQPLAQRIEAARVLLAASAASG